MKNKLSNLFLSITNVDKNYIQTVLMILVLVMLVLGAGAPEVVGGSGL